MSNFEKPVFPQSITEAANRKEGDAIRNATHQSMQSSVVLSSAAATFEPEAAAEEWTAERVEHLCNTQSYAAIAAIFRESDRQRNLAIRTVKKLGRDIQELARLRDSVRVMRKTLEFYSKIGHYTDGKINEENPGRLARFALTMANKQNDSAVSK